MDDGVDEVADGVYLGTDGDGALDTVLTGADAAPFPVDPAL